MDLDDKRARNRSISAQENIAKALGKIAKALEAANDRRHVSFLEFNEDVYEFLLINGETETGKIHRGETKYSTCGEPLIVALAHLTSSGEASTVVRVYIPWRSVVSFHKLG